MVAFLGFMYIRSVLHSFDLARAGNESANRHPLCSKVAVTPRYDCSTKVCCITAEAVSCLAGEATRQKHLHVSQNLMRFVVGKARTAAKSSGSKSVYMGTHGRKKRPGMKTLCRDPQHFHTSFCCPNGALCVPSAKHRQNRSESG